MAQVTLTIDGLSDSQADEMESKLAKYLTGEIGSGVVVFTDNIIFDDEENELEELEDEDEDSESKS